MIALDAEVALRRPAEIRVLVGRELARLDGGVPRRAADVVRRDLLAVEPMLDVRALRHDARLIPLTGRLRGILRSGEQVVHRPREVVVLLVVLGVLVIEELILWRAPVDLVERVGPSIEHTAVAGVANVPLELELEIAELFFR